jgi:CBS domain-containing protein
LRHEQVWSDHGHMPGEGRGVNVVSIEAPRLVGDVMATEPIIVAVDAGLGDAATLFERHQISGLPVVDGSGALVGVVAESDLLRARATDYLWASWPTLRVKHLMTTPALTIRRDEPLTVAARRMARHRVSRLVVVADEDDTRTIGVIAISDLLRAMAELPADEPPAPVRESAEPLVPVPDLDPDAPEERGD